MAVRTRNARLPPEVNRCCADSLSQKVSCALEVKHALPQLSQCFRQCAVLILLSVGSPSADDQGMFLQGALRKESALQHQFRGDARHLWQVWSPAANTAVSASCQLSCSAGVHSLA